MTKKVLGRGLEALIPESVVAAEGPKTIEISVTEIIPNPYQPRQEFNEAKLAELENSILENGIIQPVLVRQVSNGYELIAGERRLRAAKKAGLEKIPAMIRDISSQSALELSLVENIQRDDLNPLEEAQAYQRLLADFNYTQEKLAKRLGKDRSSIANTLRLLKLSSFVQHALVKDKISRGHALAILSLPLEQDQKRMAQLIMDKGLSVRKTEDLAKTFIVADEKAIAGRGRQKRRSAYLEGLEKELQRFFGTKVRVRGKENKGTIEIKYFSEEDFERILELLQINTD